MRREYSQKLVIAANQNIKEREYWLQKLSGELEKACFPPDYKNEIRRKSEIGETANRSGSVGIEINDETAAKLATLSKGSDYTLNLIFITAVAILLNKYSGSSDIVLGMPIYRQEEDGDLINRVLALRNHFQDHMTVKQLLQQVRRTIMEAVAHVNYPIEILAEQLGLPNISTLFDVAVSVKNIHHKKDIQSIRLNILFTFERKEQIIKGQLEYNALLYREDTAEHIGRRLQYVLQGMLENPNGEICRIDLLSEEEKHKILEEFNDTRTDYPREKTICQLFAEQAARTPDGVAVVGKEKRAGETGEKVQMTYLALNEKSERLAGVLKARGVTPDSIVAITGHNSIETIIGISGILKAGGAYLPIDPDYPRERRDYMLKDSNAALLLTSDELSDVGGGKSRGKKYFAPTTCNLHLSLAYVIYTSGSTGRPRGVMVNQRSVVRLVKNSNFIIFEPHDRILQTGALEFDASTFEIWGALLNGITLCLVDRDDLLNPVKLKAAVQKSSASIMWMTSPLFNRMVQEDVEIFKGLKKLLVGGDVLSPPHIEKVKKAYPHLDVINGYGPTENTTFSVTQLIGLPINGGIPIGKPIANSTAYIVDKYGYLQPVGIAGELVVGGEGAARGYLNNPELTAEKFIYWSYRTYKTYSSNKIYRTGDLGRWLPDGTIEFLGRRDFQVKIRGFRIEPEEIENRLLESPQVKEAVVIDKAMETGEKYLCAYIVLSSVESGETPSALVELREHLSGVLPDYMVPSYFVPLERIPLTANGKVDRKALPEPVLSASAQYAAPGNDIEEKLVEIWTEALGSVALRASSSQGIGIDDNFFEIGGHSLKATNVISWIHKHFEVNVELRDFFSHPTIREVASMIREAEVRKYEEIQPGEEREYYDLSYAQRRLWILCQFEADSAAYNIPAMFPLSGFFDGEAFKQAVQTMVDRHEILRTVFATIAGIQKQKIVKNLTFNLEESDLLHLDASTREIEAQRIYNADAEHVFDLENGPLFRFRYVRLEDEKCLVVFVIHHIISDGWSQGVIVNEVLTAYNGKSLPPMKLQYRDYTRWHNTLIARGHYNRAQQFWLEKFKDKPNGIELPTDHARKPVQTFNGRRLPFPINREIISKLNEVRQQEDATLFMGLLSLLNIFLYKYTGQTDIIVGSPIAGRRQPELHNMIGFLVNTLVYRNRVVPEESLRDHLRRVGKDTLTCYDYQDYPFDLLVERLELDRDLSQSPLFNVMLAHNNADIRDDGITMKGISVTGFPQTDNFNMSKFDLTFFMDEAGDQVFVRLEYNSDLFERGTIQRMANNFLYLVKELVENSDTPISQFHALHPGEYRNVLHDVNDTGCRFPGLTVQELFQQQVEKTPGKTAAVFPETETQWKSVSYKELNRQANRLAHYLRNRYQVKPNDIVGISLDRSLDMIAAILGVIKSGAGYAAIDPNYPEDRVLHMLADSRCQLVIRDCTNPGLFGNYNGKIIVFPGDWEIIAKEGDSNPEMINKPADILYVIYTSGTTGTPNGAVLTHGLLYNLVQWQKQNTSIDASLRCLQFTTTSFCVSFQEIMITLVSGGELHLIGDIQRQDVEYLLHFLTAHKIELLYLPFSYLNFLFNQSDRWGENFKHSLKHIVTAGEQLKITSGLKDFLARNPHLQLHNHYGSSEMHVVTSYTLDGVTAGRYPVPPAGKPIANTKIYILDDYLNPVPIGVWGEIFVEGAVEVAGYINNRVLTQDKLISIPPVTGDTRKLYRSGDVGRWLEDGNIEFKGRKDSQVKIRGFRVELSEIESRLLAVDRVKECVVEVRENQAGQKELFAYVVLDGIETAEIKKILGLYLPQHMMPRFIVLESLPLMPNGKVDRERLPEPDTTVGERETYSAPRSELEEQLAEIWSHLLGIDKNEIGIDDNFFELGGHSLKATTMVSRIHKELNVKAQLLKIFQAPTIRELANYIGALTEDIFTAVAMVEKKEYYPAAPAQKRLYLLYRMDQRSTAYNLFVALEMEGELEPARLQKTFKQLIQRQESLRTSFEMVDGEPVQRVYDEVEFEIEYIGAEHGSERGIQDFIRPFDLCRAPLFRVGLIKIEEQKYTFMFDIHHIAADGISLGLLVNEFTTLYSRQPLPPLRIRYKDFSHWQNRLLGSVEIKQQESYWKNIFAGEIPVLNLPTDFPRPVFQVFEGDTLGFILEAKETAALKDLVKTVDATLYMCLLAIFSILLSKLSGQEDIVVGSPIAGRKHADLEPLIGMFVNTLAFRNFPSGEKTFLNYLEEVRARTLAAYENQDYQFEDLVEQLSRQLPRDTGRNPLFDVMFSLLNMEIPAMNIPGLSLKPAGYRRNTALFDLTLNAVESREMLGFSLQYCTALFKKETIHRFIGYFKVISAALAENPGIKISDIEIITWEEKQRLLLDFNSTQTDYPRDRTIQQLFEEQAARTPDSTAVVGVERRAESVEQLQITYKELNERSGRLAYWLRQKGIGTDTILGIMVERSVEMVIGILGILKTGGAYLPIDPGYPQERIDFMLKDSNAALLLTSDELSDVGSVGKGTRFCAPTTCNLHLSLAYVIYTSGSTGQPKGVMVNHQPVINLLFYLDKEYPFAAADTYLLKTSYIFDVSVTELFGWFLKGGRLAVLPGNDEKDPRKILYAAARHHVTHLNFVPSMFHAFMETLEIDEESIDCLSSLKYIFLAGEALQGEVINRFRVLNSRIRLENIYGPTEAAVYASKYSLCQWDGQSAVPIGKPVQNTKLYILDRFNNPQPVGVSGELCIGGEGLARGYLNRPELTAERFFVSSYRSYKTYRTYIPKKLYKTGDLTRWLADGNIEFLGRMDHQVKIRGFRIELGEIESRLLAAEGIKEAVVTAREDENNEKYLCAYFVSNLGQAVDTSELGSAVSDRLPDYMVPAYFMQLNEIPLLPSGKVDRKKLPGPAIIAGKGYAALRDAVEAKLAEIWADLLNIEKENISINTGFFDVGGHSLKAAILTARIHKEFNVIIPMARIFTVSTIKDQAEYIRKSGKEHHISIEPVEEKEYYPLSSAQKRLYFLYQMSSHNVYYNMPQTVPLKADIDGQQLKDIFLKLIARHESLRTSFHMVKGEPVQRIHEQVEFEIEYFDSAQLPTDFIRPFDLSRVPLIRAGLITTREKINLLLIDMHHIITDGTSQDILSGEFSTLDAGKKLPGINLRYRDYAEWQDSEKQRGALTSQEDYWLREFSDEAPVLYLPADYPRPPVQSFTGGVFRFILNKDKTSALYEISRKNDATLFMTLLAIFNLLLHRLSGQDDIIIGTVVSGRRHADLEKIIGMFVNTLALRNYPQGKKRFPEFLAEVKEKTLAAFENQDYSFEDLVEKAVLRRDTSRNPIFDVMFTLQNQSEYNYETKEEAGEAAEAEKAVELHGFMVAKFDITFNCVELGRGGNLLVNIEYCSQLFKAATIRRFIGYLQQIISSITRNLGQRLGEIDLLAKREKEQLLYDFNDTYSDYPADKTIHQLFEEQTARTPEKIAVVGSSQLAVNKPEKTHIIYRVLNEKTNQLAEVLKEKGVLADDIIGIMMGRSIEMIIGILGIMKAGGAYLPIEPEYPQERINYMLKDSGAKILLTNLSEGHQFNCQLSIVNYQLSMSLSEADFHHSSNRFIDYHSGSLAYVIYTSGTTGRPKGTLIEHRSLVNHCIWHSRYYQVTETDHCTQYASFGFDASVFEIFPYLIKGAALHIIHDTIKLDMFALKEYYVKHDITITFLPTQFCQQFMKDETETPSLRAIITGGEKLNRFVKRSYGLYNNYGPTENTVVTTVYPVDLEKAYENIPIGKPVYNNRVYILDQEGFRLQPIGVPGELCIFGDSLARGYLNRPELTAERFVSGCYRSYGTYRTYISSKVIYKTGDLARWLSDGNIEFLGRIDQQVKISGYRIELGEIENQLRSIKPIIDAAVIDRLDHTGQKYLCAYVTAEARQDVQQIKEMLARRLPPYMIPPHLVQVDEIPLTLNGKVDRKKLPVPEVTAGEMYTAPRNEIEDKLVGVWSEVLGIEKGIIGIDANFFGLGGNSIKLMTVNTRLNQQMQKNIPVVKLFTYPTIRALSSYLADESKETVLGKDRSETITSRRSKLIERKRR